MRAHVDMARPSPGKAGRKWTSPSRAASIARCTVALCRSSRSRFCQKISRRSSARCRLVALVAQRLLELGAAVVDALAAVLVHDLLARASIWACAHVRAVAPLPVYKLRAGVGFGASFFGMKPLQMTPCGRA